MIKSIKSFKQVIHELMYILDKGQKQYAMLLFIASFLNSACELVGIAIILPFIQVVQNPDIVMNKPFFNECMQKFNIKSESELLVLLGISIIVVYAIKAAYAIFFNWLQNDYATRFSYQIATKTLKSYLQHPYTFFLEINSSEILRGCGSDVELVSAIISSFLAIVSSLITIIIIGGYLLYTDLFISVSMIGIMGVMMIVMLIVFKPMMKEVGQLDVVLTNKKNVALIQAANGIKEIFVSQKQDFFFEQYKEAYDKSRKMSRKFGFYNGLPNRVIEAVCASGIIVVLCIKIIGGSVTDDFLPRLAIFAVSIFKLFPLCSLIINRINAVVFARPRLRNLYAIQKEADEFEKYNKSIIDKKLNDTEEVAATFDKSLHIDNISWKYARSSEYIFNNLSLNIKKGESVAFIGSSGAGKTTLADTILGLFKPLSGSIMIDGVDISTIPNRWAQMVSYVPQSVYLIDDCVRNNIVFGEKPENISDEKVWECLKEAALYDFVKSLPDGLDTQVGERGIRFSGGQKQRIAIARALYNKPEILVLDEATSALDNETEAAIMESIDNLKGRITMIIIAHRLSTVKNCDRILEIKDGQAIEVDKKELFIR